MENISVPRDEYERLKAAFRRLKELEKIDFDLVRQFRDSLEDLKEGRIRRAA